MIAATLPLAHMGFGEHMGDWGAGWWILMAFLMVAFWGLVIVGIVWLVRSLGWGQHDHRGASAIELLDRRLASGEISPDEYRERRAVLRGEPGAGTSGGAERG
jgi:putative membrane protein